MVSRTRLGKATYKICAERESAFAKIVCNYRQINVVLTLLFNLPSCHLAFISKAMLLFLFSHSSKRWQDTGLMMLLGYLHGHCESLMTTCFYLLLQQPALVQKSRVMQQSSFTNKNKTNKMNGVPCWICERKWIEEYPRLRLNK